jgi:hypothetical protein
MDTPPAARQNILENIFPNGTVQRQPPPQAPRTWKKSTEWWERPDSQPQAAHSGEEKETPWGRNQDGIQIRLQATRRTWKQGEDCKFKVEIRNAGTRELTTSGIASLALEAEGEVFPPRTWMQRGAIARLPFGPGKEYEFNISLKDFGSNEWEFAPGKHTITAILLNNSLEGSVLVQSIDRKTQNALAVSNSVVVEVKAAGPDKEVTPAPLETTNETYQSATYLQKTLAAKIPDTVWGKARDGLRLAMVVRDPTNTEWNDLPAGPPIPASVKIRAGEHISCQLVVENVSNHAVNLSDYTYSEMGRTVEVLNSNGHPVPIELLANSIEPVPSRWRLLPGERFLLGMPPINFLTKLLNNSEGYNVTVPPGHYTLRCSFEFGIDKQNKNVRDSGSSEWTGTLSTAAIKVNVLDPQ